MPKKQTQRQVPEALRVRLKTVFMACGAAVETMIEATQRADATSQASITITEWDDNASIAGEEDPGSALDGL